MTERAARDGFKWEQLLAVAGAGGGLLVIVYLVGGIIVWERVHALQLPANHVIPLVPRELLIVVGVRALAWPLGLGFLVIVLVQTQRHVPRLRRAVVRRVLVILSLAYFVLLVGVALFSTAQHLVFAFAFGLVLAAALVAVVRWNVSPNWAGIGGFLGLAMVVVVVESIDIARLPVRLEYADVRLLDRSRAQGYFLGASTETLLLAPNDGCRVRGQILIIPRETVATLTIYSSSNVWGQISDDVRCPAIPGHSP